jgi:hypothetical protein
MSYYFQPGILRLVVSLPQYLKDLANGFGESPTRRPPDLIGMMSTAKSTMVAFTITGSIAGGLLGAWLERTRR